MAEALNITVELEDIEISHKICRGKAIIAKFVNHKVKCKLKSHVEGHKCFFLSVWNAHGVAIKEKQNVIEKPLLGAKNYDIVLVLRFGAIH